MQGYHSTGISAKNNKRNSVQENKARQAKSTKPVQRNPYAIGSTITIPMPANCLRHGQTSTETVEARILTINHRGNFAVVEYKAGKQMLTTTVALMPIVTRDKNGKKKCALANRGTVRSSKCGFMGNSHMPTPFNQNMTAGAAMNAPRYEVL